MLSSSEPSHRRSSLKGSSCFLQPGSYMHCFTSRGAYRLLNLPSTHHETSTNAGPIAVGSKPIGESARVAWNSSGACSGAAGTTRLAAPNRLESVPFYPKACFPCRISDGDPNPKLTTPPSR